MNSRANNIARNAIIAGMGISVFTLVYYTGMSLTPGWVTTQHSGIGVLLGAACVPALIVGYLAVLGIVAMKATSVAIPVVKDGGPVAPANVITFPTAVLDHDIEVQHKVKVAA